MLSRIFRAVLVTQDAVGTSFWPAVNLEVTQFSVATRPIANESVKAHTRRTCPVSAICATRHWHRYGDQAMDQQSQVGSAALAPTRATALIRRVGRPILLRVGIAAVLEVSGRRTGTSRRISLIPVEMDGTWYVMGFGGITDWVRNLRAAGRGELHHKGRSTAFTAVEVDGSERERVIAAYLAKVPKPIQRDFGRRPNAAHHPTFRLEPVK